LQQKKFFLKKEHEKPYLRIKKTSEKTVSKHLLFNWK